MAKGNPADILAFLLSFLNDTEHMSSLWPKSRFELTSLKRWAAGELVEDILDHPGEDADDIVFNFWMKMTCYQIEATDDHAIRVFSTAARFAEHLLDTTRKEYLPDYE